jgi:hypothetical protein
MKNGSMNRWRIIMENKQWSLADTLKAYLELRKRMPDANLAELAPGILGKPVNQQVSSTPDLWRQFRDFQPAMGWFTLPSQHKAFDGDLPKLEDPFILAGELFNRQNDKSLHVKYNGDGSWHCCEFTVKTNVAFDQADCLVEPRDYLCRDGILPKSSYKWLLYQCFWMPGDPDSSFEQGMNIRFARFIGFAEKSNVNTCTV